MKKAHNTTNIRLIRTESRLEAQLKGGVKNGTNANPGTFPLTETDVTRIKKELQTLKSKIIR